MLEFAALFWIFSLGEIQCLFQSRYSTWTDYNWGGGHWFFLGSEINNSQHFFIKNITLSVQIFMSEQTCYSKFFYTISQNFHT